MWLKSARAAAVHVVDFYLDDVHEKERNHILQLVQKKDTSSDELLQGYVREAMRQCFSSYIGQEVCSYVHTTGLNPQVRRGEIRIRGGKCL